MSAEASLELKLSHKNNSRRRLLSEYLSRRRYFIIRTGRKTSSFRSCHKGGEGINIQAFYHRIGMLITLPSVSIVEELFISMVSLHCLSIFLVIQ